MNLPTKNTDPRTRAILTQELRFENDIVSVRRRARQIAGSLGFHEQDQTRITTAVSEIARNAFQYAGGGRVEYLVEGEARQQQAVQEMAGEILAKRGKRLSAGAWSALGQKTGFSLRESLSAIEKLITYAGEKTQIEAADVEAVVGRTREDTVFELNGALVGRNLTLALRTLHDLLAQGLHPLMIMTMITREIRFLFQAKLLIASGRLGAFQPNMDYGRFQKAVHPAVKQLSGDGKEGIAIASQHPFVVYQALKNAGRFTRAELAGYLDLLVRTDLALKTTGQDPRLLLERILITVCRAGNTSNSNS